MKIIDQLASMEEKSRTLSDLLLANLVMIGEVPAPTFHEERRIEFIKNRFIENGLQEISIDEEHNIVGMIPGKTGKRNILLIAHVDTVFSEKSDHTISIVPNKVIGPGVADNSLGVAVLVTIPELIETLGLELDANLWLLGETKSLGRGNLQSLRFFLENSPVTFDQAICLEGAQLGRLSYSSVGMIRGEITCSVPEEYNWMRMSYTNAIITINEIINKIVDIPLPQRPKSSIVLGSVEGGTAFNSIATTATLKFEIRSESEAQVNELLGQFEEFVAEIDSTSGIRVEMDLVSNRKPGGIPFSHPLTKAARKIIDTLGIDPYVAPSSSELAALINQKIPAVTIGLTTADHLRQQNETIHIEPIYKGIAQLAGLLTAIDEGEADEY